MSIINVFFLWNACNNKAQLWVWSKSSPKEKFCLKVTSTCWGFSYYCFAWKFIWEWGGWRCSTWRPSKNRRLLRWSKFDFLITIYILGPIFNFVSCWGRNNSNIQRLQLESMGQMQRISAITCKILCLKHVSVKKKQNKNKGRPYCACLCPWGSKACGQ